MAQVSGVEVQFKANTDDLERGVGLAQKALGRFAKAAVGAVSVGVFVAAGKAALNYADKISKVSQKIGMTTEELSGLTYAAKLSDVSIEQLQSSLGMMARRMGESADSFEAFGVSLKNTDGSMRSTNQVLLDVAEKFSKMPDGVQKSQWAFELFGRSGLELIPLLNSGASGIAEMTAQARLFGVVVSQEAAKGAEHFNDNLTRLQEYVFGAVQSFTTGMTPALVNVSEALVNSAKSTDVFKTAGQAAGRILEGMARAVMVVRDNLGLLGDILKGIGLVIFTRYVFGAAAGFVAFAKAVKAATITMVAFNAAKKVGLAGFITLAAGIAVATDSVDELKKGLDFIYETAASMVPGMAELGKTIADAVGIDLSSLDADLSAARAMVEAANGDMASIPLIPGAGGGGKDKDENTSENPMQEEGNFFTDRLQMIRDNFKTEREVLEEEYAMNQAVLDNALLNERIKREEHATLTEQLAKEHQDALSRIQSIGLQNNLATAADFFSSMEQIASLGGKKATKIAKVFGIAQALISTFQGAARALTLPYPANLAAYASTLAQGMSAVASIKGVNENGGGNGGSGGKGGSARGAASAATGGASGGGGGPTTTFQFTLQNDPMGFGEKFARQFIDQLNSTQRNGGQIRGVIA
jgi:hypothetical protein